MALGSKMFQLSGNLEPILSLSLGLWHAEGQASGHHGPASSSSCPVLRVPGGQSLTRPSSLSREPTEAWFPLPGVMAGQKVAMGSKPAMTGTWGLGLVSWNTTKRSSEHGDGDKKLQGSRRAGCVP